MKKLPYVPILLLLIFSCKEPKKAALEKAEAEYAALFDKEYAEFIQSERYQLFDRKYQELCALTHQIHGNKFTGVRNKLKPDTLRFKPKSNKDWEADTKAEEERKKGLIRVRTFDEYVNLSHEINAIIVGSEFCEKSDTTEAKFRFEEDIHKAFAARDKDKFIRLCGETAPSSSYLYSQFCKARIQMDKLIHCRYFLVLKKVELLPWEYKETKEKREEFIPAWYTAQVCIYGVDQKRVQYAVEVFAKNSSSIAGTRGSMEQAVDTDLENNIQKAIMQALGKEVGVKGGLPSFMWKD